MVEFDAIILQFAEQGEKTGWSYIDIPADIAQELKPGNKKSFRVKGMLDGYAINGIALMPMGEGNFIMSLKAEIRKAIHKNRGAMVRVKIEADNDFKIEMPDDLQECLNYEPEAMESFNRLPGSHRNYFITWINSAKTEPTREKRIIHTVNAMIKSFNYGQMIRELKKERN